jgi:hypothetical protein
MLVFFCFKTKKPMKLKRPAMMKEVIITFFSGSNMIPIRARVIQMKLMTRAVL